MFHRKRRSGPSAEERYRTLAPLGEGGVAFVSRAFDASLCRIVAVKELKEDESAVDLAQRSLVREERLISYLDHPGIAPVYDHYVKAHARPCYAMKLVEGETLADRIGFKPPKGGKALPPAEAVALFRAIARTLAHVHDRGVVHLDVKPENVMLGRYGEVFLMDWGNARLFDPAPYRGYLGAQADDDDVALLVEEPPDLLSGTPQFMSPEQTCRPREELGPASDIFSAGALFFLMLTGAVPFRGKDVRSLLTAIRTEEPPSIRELNPAVPPRLAGIVRKMLAKDVAERHASFRDVLADLAAYAEAGEGFPTRHLRAGEVLFREGEIGDAAYLVMSGSVEILKQGPQEEQCLATLGPGEILGELAILSDQPRSATVKAVEPTELRVMAREAVEKELEKVPPWVHAMLSTLAERFLDLNERLIHGPGGGSANETGASA